MRMLIQTKITFLLLFCGNVLLAQIPSIELPATFKIIKREKQHPNILVNYICEDKIDNTCPSINIFYQPGIRNQEQYLEKIKLTYLSKPEQNGSYLPAIDTKSGRASLFQIDKKIAGIDIHLFQLIHFKGETAYIVTACMHKKHLKKYEPIIFKAFESFSVQ